MIWYDDDDDDDDDDDEHRPTWSGLVTRPVSNGSQCPK